MRQNKMKEHHLQKVSLMSGDSLKILEMSSLEGSVCMQQGHVWPLRPSICRWALGKVEIVKNHTVINVQRDDVDLSLFVSRLVFLYCPHIMKSTSRFLHKCSRKFQHVMKSIWKGKLCTLLWKYKLVQPLWTSAWGVLKTLKVELLYDASIATLPQDPTQVTYPRDFYN